MKKLKNQQSFDRIKLKQKSVEKSILNYVATKVAAMHFKSFEAETTICYVFHISKS